MFELFSSEGLEWAGDSRSELDDDKDTDLDDDESTEDTSELDGNFEKLESNSAEGERRSEPKEES